MKVVVSAVGVIDHTHKIVWPKDWPVPREGDTVDIPALPEVAQVRTVVWCPEGQEDSPKPYVYIVVGPARR